MTEERLCTSCGKAFEARADGSNQALCQECANKGARNRDQEVSIVNVRRALTKRLGAVIRGFESMPGTDREMTSIEDILKSIRNDIATGYGPNGEDLDFIQIADQISFVMKPLKRAGQDAMVEDLTLIKQTIEKLATVAARQKAKTHIQPEASASEEVVSEIVEEDERIVATSARRGGPAVAAGTNRLQIVMVVFAAVIIVGVALWFLMPDREPSSTESVDHQAPTAVIVTPTPTIDQTQPTPADEGMRRFWDRIGEARAALLDNDPEAASKALARATAITRDKSDIYEIADDIVGAFVAAARSAIDDSNWEYADALLGRAIDVGSDYGLDLRAVDTVVDDLASRTWTYRIEPDDVRSAVQRLKGVEIVVERVDGTAQVGTVSEVGGSDLVLTGEHALGGGKVAFETEIPLAEIRYLRYTASPELAAVSAARKRAAKKGVGVVQNP